MTVPEFIGFVVSMIALALLSYRRSREERRRREHPELYEHEERENEDALKKLLESLDVPEEEIPPELTHDKPLARPSTPAPRPIPVQRPVEHSMYQTPKPIRTVKSDFRFQSTLDKKRQANPVEERRFASRIEGREKVRFGKAVVSTDMGTPLAAVDSYKIIRREKRSRLEMMLQRLSSPRDMIVFHEVLMPPKALRDTPYKELL